MKRIRKALVALAGALLQLVLVLPDIQSYLPPEWSPYISGVIAVATAAGVYAVRNAPTAPATLLEDDDDAPRHRAP